MFKTTIQGYPWAPCAACPHPTPEACASRRHPPFCRLMAVDPEKWGPIIAAQPPELRSMYGEPPLPGLTTEAANLAGAIVAVATHAATHHGTVLASKSVQQARWTVCTTGAGLSPDQTVDGHCDRFRPSDGRCSACGCKMPIKVRLAAMKCPLDRWPELEAKPA